MGKALTFFGLGCLIVLSACAPQAPATPTQSPAPATPTMTAAAPPTSTAAALTSIPPTAESTPTLTPTPAGPCTDKASFVDDVTIPDYAHLDVKETFTKTWRIKNTGTCTWNTDYKAAYSRGDALGAPISIPLSETAPGATIDISANMAAPTVGGKYEIFYQLTNAAGDPMPVDDGDVIWALITVGKVYASPPATPTTGPSTVSTNPSGPGLTAASCIYQSNQDFINQTLSLINAQRAANGKAALTLNDKLSTAAQSHSADMACNNFLSHDGWNGSTPASRVAGAGYAASITRENIYAQPPQYGGNPQAAMDFWMGDDIHKAALLNDQVTEIGIGYAVYSRSTLGGYFTVDFAAP